MTNRTLKFYGAGHGETPVTVDVVVNGTSVYTGEIPTENQVDSINDVRSADSALAFTIDTIPVEFSGSFPMSIELTSGTGASFGMVTSNYVAIPNPVFSPEDIAIIEDPTSSSDARIAIYTRVANPPLSESDIELLTDAELTKDVIINEDDQLNLIQIINDHNINTSISSGPDVFENYFWSGDCRTDVTVNGESVVLDKPPEIIGTWTWQVPGNAAFACNININAGIE